VIERLFVYDWDMSAAPITVVDEHVDPSDLCDSQLRERYTTIQT
jgi:hypothetical protein